RDYKVTGVQTCALPIFILSLSPLIPWILIQPLHSRFSDISATFTSFGEITALIGITMYSLTLFMSARLELFENFFGGMNRVYVEIGRASCRERVVCVVG